MDQALVIIDVQPTFDPPDWLVTGIGRLVGTMPSFATVERHDEAQTPFMAQIGWSPAADDSSLIAADEVFIKHGYAPPAALLERLRSLAPKRVLVCGLQADTCVLAAGFAFFDAGLRPTLISDLVAGSSVDRSGGLGVALWRHHFHAVVTTAELTP